MIRILVSLAALCFTVPASAGAKYGANDVDHKILGECVLKVDGKTHIDGPCAILLGKTGYFGVYGLTNDYFSFVSPSNGIGDGSWNGVEQESHAHEDLGTLVRDGGCWSNRRATVCAWTKGTRPH